MAGNIGSPLCAELNRIANNGVYPDRDDFLEEQGAANVWAGTTGQGLLGALNYIVDPTRTENNFSDLTKVCNELAGTTGLSDVDALRTINHAAEVLLRGTTPQSAVFTTDAAVPRYNYPGFIRLNGVDGNFISTPDAVALDITGDVDLRIRVALDDWTPSTSQTLLSKLNTSQFSYQIILNTTGTVSFRWSANGTTLLTSTSSVAPTVADGATLWVRATMDVDNGASGNTVTFFTSNNGTTWTQLGTTIVTAGVTSIFNGTASVEIGSHFAGSNVLTGNIYQAQIFAGLTGTDKRLDVDLTTNVTSATYDQFTATTGQLCTINGQNTLTNTGKAGALLPTTVGSSLAADSNDAKFLDHTGTNYVYLPGIASNFLTTPDAAALDITGDIDLRAYVALDDWTPASTTNLVGKWQGGSNRSYSLRIDTTGVITFAWSQDGTAALSASSTVATGVADGAAKWIRATFDVDNGASGRTATFFTSDNGTAWTQLGTAVTTAGVTSIFNSTLDVFVGNEAGINMLAGKVYRAQIFGSINDTNKVLDVDTSVITTGATTSFTAVTGQTITINRSTSGRKTVAVTQPTWLFGTDDYMEVNNRYMDHTPASENYVYLSGNTGNYMSVTDSPPLDVTGDLDLQVRVALDDWTPGSSTNLIDKWTSPSNLSYVFLINTSGNLVFAWTTSGASGTQTTTTSTSATGVTDGTVKWVRVTLDVDNGASGNDVKFWTSDNGTTWTQLGTTITTAGVTSVYSGAAPVALGANTNGAGSNLKGKFFRAIIKNGIDGTTVLDANAAVITLPSQTTFTDSSSNAYTVTINKSGVGTFVSTGNYMYLPGVNVNYASTPDAAALDITGDIDLRVKVAMDDWTPSAVTSLIAKWEADATRSWHLRLLTNGTLQFRWYNSLGIVSGTILSTVATGVADGATKWVRATFDVDNGAGGNDVKFFLSDDGLTWTQLGATVTTAGTTNIRNGTAALWVGADDTGSINPARGKFFRAQVLNGIGGTVAFDANFENSITSLNQASFTESSSNAATVTINRSGSTFRSAGVIDAGYLYPGATNTFANSTIDYLNFGANQDFTVLAVARQFGSTAGNGEIISKNFNYGSSAVNGYNLVIASGFTQNFFTTVGAGTYYYSNSTNVSAGNAFLLSMVRSGATVVSYNNANAVGTGAVAGTLSASLANFQTLRIGTSNQNAQFFAGEVYGAAVFRSALTAKNIADIYNYFNGRD